MSQKLASGVIRVTEAREGVSAPAPTVGTRVTIPCAWYQLSGVGGRTGLFPDTSAHGEVHVQFASKIQGQLPRECEAPGRDRSIRWAESPCWRLGGTTSARVPVKRVCECTHLFDSDHQAGLPCKLDACTAGKRDRDLGRGMAWMGHVSHPQICVCLLF